MQLLPALLARYDVELRPQLVGPPPDAAAPERERLVAYARRDAADVAPFQRLPDGSALAFEDPGAQPDADAVALAGRILVDAVDAADFVDRAARAGRARWSDDRVALEALAREQGCAAADALPPALAAGNARRERLGHYSGAMLHYAGEWYWGIDRLAYLEARLADLGARRPGAPPGPALVQDRSVPTPAGRGDALTLEFFPSLRSPYTAICFERVYALVDRYGVSLAMRPVLPMVMRGLPVPVPKRLYIVRDTRREAESAAVPFGRVSDPVGRPVERAFSLWPCMRDRGRGNAYLHAAAQAAFAEGIDLGREAGLRRVVERVGVDWGEVRLHLDDEAWRPELERNRKDLFDLGLWGVPSFRLRGPEGTPDYTTWGQDRLWRIEQEIARRLA